MEGTRGDMSREESGTREGTWRGFPPLGGTPDVPSSRSLAAGSYPAAHSASGFVSVVEATITNACKPLSSGINQTGYMGSDPSIQPRYARKFTPIASILFRDRRSNSKIERAPHG